MDVWEQLIESESFRLKTDWHEGETKLKILVCCVSIPFLREMVLLFPFRLQAATKVDCLFTDTAQKMMCIFYRQNNRLIKCLCCQGSDSQYFTDYGQELFLGIPSFHTWSYEKWQTPLGFNPKEYDVDIGYTY